MLYFINILSSIFCQPPPPCTDGNKRTIFMAVSFRKFYTLLNSSPGLNIIITNKYIYIKNEPPSSCEDENIGDVMVTHG